MAPAVGNVPQSGRAATSERLLSPILDGFALSGVSLWPDPATHAYRKDLADAALAGRVIASHYAEPLLRHMIRRTMAYIEPSNASEVIATLCVGDALNMLDCSRGWAWGYLANGRVAYVEADAVSV